MTWKNDKDRRDSCMEFESKFLYDIMSQLKIKYNFDWFYEVSDKSPAWGAHLSILMDYTPRWESLWVGLCFDWQDNTKILDNRSRLIITNLADPEYLNKIYNHFINLKEQYDTRRH